MIRSLRLFAFAAVAALALSSLAAPAFAQVGAVSLGGNFGVGFYSPSDINDALEAADFEKITSGLEFGGSIRYQFSEKAALDLEVNKLNPKSSTPDPGNPDIEYSLPALAIPLSLVYTLSENDQYRFNLVVGGGLLSSVKLRGEQGPTELETDGESGIMGQAGFETMWKLSPQFGLTARALGRIGSATVDDSGTEYDVSYAGGTLGVGARVSFGGGQ